MPESRWQKFTKWLRGAPAPIGHPHNWRAGLARAWQVHLPFFGGPSAALFFVPPGPWKVAPAAALVAWRAYAEFHDWHTHQDTASKALIDFASQTAVAVVAAAI